ncbi:GNAT family N-acetyltransferase [Moorena bouillonii]|uniref:N-acetyltransferase domain-containing protein n=1 Tax=Moorena bouillonii PNG TaxID=568701 RepID=A0A1U7MX31_9CYAN|nr:GNAT family N-acetyltransferase [Moorena bouillonii]OLT58270.1 hypothetical protein BJP37_03630 [Moorena bouillonii PNG]
MTEFQIRLAQISDVEPILAFCQYTWENKNDYMHLVLEKRINNPENKVFVVTLDDIPVAMQEIVILSKQEAWLSSLRVDRRYRRRGLSKLLDAHTNIASLIPMRYKSLVFREQGAGSREQGRMKREEGRGKREEGIGKQ